MAKRRHVVPSGNGWSNKVAGAKRSTSKHHTQAQAIDAARRSLTKEGGGELTIHGRDGRIRDSDTVAPGNDPNPPKDRR